MTIIDDTLFVLGFNYTRLDIERSRSFGLATRDKKLVQDARSLFEADSTRQPFAPGDSRLVVIGEVDLHLVGALSKTPPDLDLVLRQQIVDELLARVT